MVVVKYFRNFFFKYFLFNNYRIEWLELDVDYCNKWVWFYFENFW